MELGDFFPEALRADHAKRSIKVGSVLRMAVKDTDPPKIKYFVIVGINRSSDAIAVCYINTEVNPNVHSTPYRQGLQLKLLKKDHDFFDWDCHWDCTVIVEKCLSEIQGVVEGQPKCCPGEVIATELAAGLNRVKRATTIITALKKKYGLV